MGKGSGKGLAVAGFVLGLVGAGLGGFLFFNSYIAPMIGLTHDPSITNYYSEDDSHVFSSTGTWETLETINLTITVPTNAQVYILFNGNTCYGAGASGSICYVQFLVDGAPFKAIIQTAGDAMYADSVTLQYYGTEDFTPGTYVVTVRVSVGNINDVIVDFSLFVQIIS